jgi:hypothetical protein
MADGLCECGSDDSVLRDGTIVDSCPDGTSIATITCALASGYGSGDTLLNFDGFLTDMTKRVDSCSAPSGGSGASTGSGGDNTCSSGPGTCSGGNSSTCRCATSCQRQCDTCDYACLRNCTDDSQCAGLTAADGSALACVTNVVGFRFCDVP